jgi:hypothetical protein
MPPANKFLQTFVERRQCLADLLELSHRQHDLVEADDYSRLLGLLGGKQQIISRLEEIGNGRPGLWDEWREERGRLTPDVRERCEQALAETEELLARLLELERVSTECLARRRDETARQLQSVAAGSRVNQAYGESLAPVTHRFLDRDQ